MATQNVEGVVTLEELMVSSLATADALAKSLSGAGSYSLRVSLCPLTAGCYVVVRAISEFSVAVPQKELPITYERLCVGSLA